MTERSDEELQALLPPGATFIKPEDRTYVPPTPTKPDWTAEDLLTFLLGLDAEQRKLPVVHCGHCCTQGVGEATVDGYEIVLYP